MKVLMMMNLFLETVCIWTLLCLHFGHFRFLFNLLFTPVTGGNWGQLHFFCCSADVILRNCFLSIDRHFMYIFTIGPLHGYWVWKGRAFVSEAADV
jgi:hypothetical protein